MDYKKIHGHDRAAVNTILWHFHNGFCKDCLLFDIDDICSIPFWEAGYGDDYDYGWDVDNHLYILLKPFWEVGNPFG